MKPPKLQRVPLSFAFHQLDKLGLTYKFSESLQQLTITYSDNTGGIRLNVGSDAAIDEKELDAAIERATIEHVCSICRKPYAGYGHNAEPINDGRCCDDCNSEAVIPTRIRRLYNSTKG